MTSTTSTMTLTDFNLIAFDADDTLWDCQGHFDDVEAQYCRLLATYATPEEVSAALFSTETANMPLLGYGSKAFTISLVENAIAISNGQVDATTIKSIIDLGKTLLDMPATPLPGVADTLRQIRAMGRWKMAVFTKGDALEQEGKIRRSGLAEMFDDCVIVADKTSREYNRLCALFDTDVTHLLMVGNSFRSDIEPVLKLGGQAIHVPYSKEWRHEATQEYSHPRLRTAASFSDLLHYL